MVKKVDSYSLGAPEEKQGYEGSCHHLISSCKHVALILMIVIGFVMYTKFLLQDVIQRANVPGFLAPVDTLYHSHSEETTDRNGVKSPIMSADNSNDRATQLPGDEHDSMNVQTQQEGVQDGPSTDMTLKTQDVPDNGTLTNSVTSSPPAKFSVLLGVFIMAYEIKRREIIRLAYRVQLSEYADFTVRFILGGYKLESWLEWENSTYGDMIVLQCKENMNAGKTFTFYSSLPDLGRQYDYVMKADDDSYVRFSNLGKHLKSFPTTDLYYGYSLPCDNDDPHHVAEFRVGAGYVLSWDLVVWIKDSPIPRNASIGTEDTLVGQWFKEGDVAKNRPYSMHLFHDHPDQGGSCARPLSKESILIHKLKTDERWYEVMDFFNN